MICSAHLCSAHLCQHRRSVHSNTPACRHASEVTLASCSGVLEEDPSLALRHVEAGASEEKATCAGTRLAGQRGLVSPRSQGLRARWCTSQPPCVVHATVFGSHCKLCVCAQHRLDALAAHVGQQARLRAQGVQLYLVDLCTQAVSRAVCVHRANVSVVVLTSGAFSPASLSSWGQG